MRLLETFKRHALPVWATLGVLGAASVFLSGLDLSSGFNLAALGFDNPIKPVISLCSLTAVGLGYSASIQSELKRRKDLSKAILFPITGIGSLFIASGLFITGNLSEIFTGAMVLGGVYMKHQGRDEVATPLFLASTASFCLQVIETAIKGAPEPLMLTAMVFYLAGNALFHFVDASKEREVVPHAG